MADNLIFLINKLSYQIASQVFDKGKFSKKKDERQFKKCIMKLRQKGCDVLLGKCMVSPLSDPCVTDYGGNWSPLTLIMDFGRELKEQGSGKHYEILMHSVKCLEDSECDYVNELFKFLLLLKGPIVEHPVSSQSNITFSGSEFLENSIESFGITGNELCYFPNEGASGTSCYKKALQYKESWTKHFDSKFQILGEFSKKNLKMWEKVSLDSLFTASSVTKTYSQSNSFVFTDFFNGKSYQSEKNLFDHTNNDLSDTSLLDSFVEHPITHKLPCRSFTPRHWTKCELLDKTNDQVKRKLNLLPEEDPLNEFSEKSSEALQEDGRGSARTSTIELKRNSNCSHSFSILYEKSASHKSQESSLGSDESSFLLMRDRVKDKFGNSKKIVLGLWEQEQTLIKEFRPELAIDYPTLRMISLLEFVEDIKYLLTGINSGTFQYDTNTECFSMKYGTCLEDVTPESLFHFSKEFLEIGNYYFRLSSCATINCQTKIDTCTTISQAFWKSIFNILELHYSVVVAIPNNTNLMALKSCTRDLYDLMTVVATICKLSKPNGTMPQGGELLTYLLEIAETLSKPSIRNTVFGILQNCCNVYFMCILQTWMFKGQLEKQNAEFFVDCRRQKVKTKSRSYYNSFYIVKERIPSFLRGYEESIFNCGKSIHFLKLFNPEDKFCQLLEKIDYPSMYLCLSDDQLEKLEKDFKDYGHKVIQSCGEGISIKNLRERERQKEKCYLEYITEFKRIQEQQRALAKIQKLKELKAKKEIKNKLLNEKISSMEAEKLRKKLVQESERRKLEEEARKKVEDEERKLNEEKNWLKNYYGQLMKSLDSRLNLAELRKKYCREILSSSNTKTEADTEETVLNIINSNENALTNLDHEGNVTSDVNANVNPNQLLTVVKAVPASGESDPATPSDKGSEKVEWDENSNPSPAVVNNNTEVVEEAKALPIKEETEPSSTLPAGKSLTWDGKEEKLRKTISNRTIASTEAERNRLKVLRSEFGMERIGEPNTEKRNEERESSLTDLQRNKKKMLEAEYDILLNPSRHISVMAVHSRTQLIDGSAGTVNPSDSKLESESLEEVINFQDVGLERKLECMNLKNPPDKPEIKPSKSDSFSSCLSPSNCVLSDEINQEVEEVVAGTSCENSESLFLNSTYQSALARDIEIFHHKQLYQDIFQNLKVAEPEYTPCTDFMKFQRFLKKSVLIPLRIQEKLANDALLKHLLKGENLMSHLKSLRGYFFLNDGEFGRCFTYNIFLSLAKCTEPQQFFERSNLSNIVNDALNYTIHNADPNAQNLSFQIVRMPPFLNHSSHDVLSPFELSYKVDWPLNIILTEKALSRYKIIFRFLLKLKRINWTLNENFILLNSHFKNKRLNRNVLVGSPHYHKIQIYRHAMTQVMITLDDYIFSNGIQFPWMYFLKDLETTENIDHLYQKHVRYIKDVLTRCFLSKNSEDLLNCIHDLIELALKFHYTAKTSVLEVVDGKYEHPKFIVLKTTFNEFCSVIKTFLRTLKEKISMNQVLKSHYVLIEKFDLKLT